MLSDVGVILTDDPSLIVVGNALRALCAIGAAVLIGLAYALCWRTTRLTEPGKSIHYDRAMARDMGLLLIGFALLTISALFTELGRIGEPVSWRLPFNGGGIALGLVSVTRLLKRVQHAARSDSP